MNIQAEHVSGLFESLALPASGISDWLEQAMEYPIGENLASHLTPGAFDSPYNQLRSAGLLLRHIPMYPEASFEAILAQTIGDPTIPRVRAWCASLTEGIRDSAALSFVAASAVLEYSMRGCANLSECSSESLYQICCTRDDLESILTALHPFDGFEHCRAMLDRLDSLGGDWLDIKRAPVFEDDLLWWSRTSVPDAWWTLPCIGDEGTQNLASVLMAAPTLAQSSEEPKPTELGQVIEVTFPRFSVTLEPVERAAADTAGEMLETSFCAELSMELVGETYQMKLSAEASTDMDFHESVVSVELAAKTELSEVAKTLKLEVSGELIVVDPEGQEHEYTWRGVARYLPKQGVFRIISNDIGVGVLIDLHTEASSQYLSGLELSVIDS